MKTLQTPKTISVPIKLGEDAIEAFLFILKNGINSWQTAGALLAEMRKDNPGVYGEIIRRQPMLTVDVLMTIERIGRKELHPQLLLNSQLPVKRLMGFPYDDQARLCSEPIDVVVNVVSGKPTVRKKLIRDMSRRELSVALDTKRVRTVPEQIEFCKAPPNGLRRMFTSAASDEEAKTNTEPPMPANMTAIGRWAVRKSMGNNCGFERTKADPPDKIRVVLDADGVAVIEVYMIKPS